MVIDLSNYDSTLVQSTGSRSGNINGNIYFDATNAKIEFLSASEAPYIDLTRAVTPTGTADVVATSMVADTYYMITAVGSTDFTTIGAATNTVGLIFKATGSGTGTGTADECSLNPLLATDGIKFEAIYAFENQERARDEILRQYDRWTSGTFKFGGAYNFIKGRIPSTNADSKIIRGSGWNEYDASGQVQKIYFGNKGLSNIEPTSQPYYQLGKFTTAVDYSKVGQIDEAVLVYDYNSGTPVDNTKNPEIVSIRTYGETHDRKATDTDLSIAELGGYSTGFAVNETPHLTTNNTDMPFVDVWTTPAGVWKNMKLENLSTPVTRDEFAESAGTFTWVLHNYGSGTDDTTPNGQAKLAECVAWLDAAAMATTDIDSGTNTTTIGKDVNTWYYYNAAGQVILRSGADSLGLYIYNIPTSDQQRLKFTDDSGASKSYQFLVGVKVDVGRVLSQFKIMQVIL